MSWIKEIDYSKSSGRLKKIYDRVKGEEDQIDNILTVHSLRPHTLMGHMYLYKSVLHHSGNALPKWYLETIGVLVSLLNKCEYCIEHHYAGLVRIAGVERAQIIREALEQKIYSHVFTDKEYSGLKYATELTSNPSTPLEPLVTSMKKLGLSDGEILEINQVTSYFNYANRTVLGLGVTIKGDILGLSPNDQSDSGNWQHA